MDRGAAIRPTRHTHRLQGGLAVISGRARLWRAPASHRGALCTSRPEGGDIKIHTSHIHPQGSPGLDPRVPAAGLPQPTGQCCHLPGFHAAQPHCAISNKLSRSAEPRSEARLSIFTTTSNNRTVQAQDTNK